MGGSGIGGNGGWNGLLATSGTANTGSGGGGGGYPSGWYDNGAGGSGIVILRYPSSYTISVPAGLTFTTDSTTVANTSITTFTAGTGNIQFN